jgi:hypothetical protein
MTPLLLDILALQQLYGPSTTNQPENTTYTFDPNTVHPDDAISNNDITIYRSQMKGLWEVKTR